MYRTILLITIFIILIVVVLLFLYCRSKIYTNNNINNMLENYTTELITISNYLLSNNKNLKIKKNSGELRKNISEYFAKQRISRYLSLVKDAKLKTGDNFNEKDFNIYYRNNDYFYNIEQEIKEAFICVVYKDKKLFKHYGIQCLKLENNLPKYAYIVDNQEQPIGDYQILRIEEYLSLLGVFLENYKYTINDLNQKFINKVKNKYTKYTKITKFYSKESDFKEHLKCLWKIGLYLVFHINNKSEPDNILYKIFETLVEDLIKECDQYKSNIHYPFNYDWFLFCSYYTAIMCYKLYIDFKIKRTIDYKYTNQIFIYIPKINYSKNIKRTGSNVAIMSIYYIIGIFFSNYYKPQIFYKFLKEYFNSDVYKKEVIIRYVKPNNSHMVEGLYPDGGFLVHGNIISYNYLLAYIYPNIFYQLLFKQLSSNTIKIFNSLFQIIKITTKKVNPVIVSRFGRFDEIYNVFYNTIVLYHNLNLFEGDKNKLFFNEFYNCFFKNTKQNNGIFFIESVGIMVARFDKWNIQLKINSSIGYGEIDIYNKQILKQIWMSKILIFDGLDINQFETHSKYPGVLSYKEFFNRSEILNIEKGTKTFILEKYLTSYGKINKENCFIYSEIKNTEFKIGYDEIVIITKYGIIVGYFNIHKYKTDDLLLTINSHIYKNNVITGILYSDEYKNPGIKKENNDYEYTVVNKNILYYNFIKGTRSDINIYMKSFNKKHNLINFCLTLNDIDYCINIKKEKEINITLTVND